MKKNVLVFPCGTEIGLEVNRALAQSSHFTLYGVNSVEDHGKHVYKNYIEQLLDMEEVSFIDAINQVISRYQIDFIIPAHDTATLILSDNQARINALVVTSFVDTCKVCRSKGETYEMFKTLIPTPQVYKITEAMNFPAFLEPDVGQGTKGTFKVQSQEEVDFHLKNDDTLIALEYLPGPEYTIDCFTNNKGALLFAQGRVRNRISNGISVHSFPIKNKQFQRLAEIINEKLSFRGVWFFQVKERGDGEMVLMEISPRIAGTMALFRACGVNFILLSLYDRMGLEVSVLQNDFEIEIDRALFARYTLNIVYDYVYIDFDDTIIVNDTVNTTLMKYLYQARNDRKKIILITKHAQHIQQTLDRFAISSLLFDEIVLVPEWKRKVDYIEHHSAIFIDDSFAERKEVLQCLKIPAFSLDAVESLLSWKE